MAIAFDDLALGADGLAGEHAGAVQIQAGIEHHLVERVDGFGVLPQDVAVEPCPTKYEPEARHETPLRNEPRGCLGSAVWGLAGSPSAKRVDHRIDGDRQEGQLDP